MARVYKIMISSTYVELQEHRRAVQEAILGQGMFPLAMENDAAIAEQDLIAASLAKVDEAEAYVGLISYRYGQTVQCLERNPNQLSLTELEFRRAEERGIPICTFIMHDEHPVPRAAVSISDDDRRRLDAFVSAAKSGRVFAEFKSVGDLKAKAIQSIARLRTFLDGKIKTLKPEENSTLAAIERPLPSPPDLLEWPRYIPAYNFVGREDELRAISEWATSKSPILMFEGLGGMGKSMLTWRWVQEHAGKVKGDWAGAIWFSFYERGADMREFCITALAYMTGSAREAFKGYATAALAPRLLTALRQRPWLIVLDGLERVLVAYHRSDAAQVRDDDDQSVDPQQLARGGDDCIVPADADLLTGLAAAGPTKVIISSRLMPKALLNLSGTALPGVDHIMLQGLAPPDAERMVRDIGVRGTSEKIQSYLDSHFRCHPLVVAVVAGLVYYYPPAPGSFDDWADDPSHGGHVNLALLDVKQRRNHILAVAFDDLGLDTRELLSRLALISEAFDWDIADALNPRRPAAPEKVRPPAPLDVDADILVRHFKDMRDSATDEERKKLVGNRLSQRQEEVVAQHNEGTDRYNAYQQALREWQQGPMLREARQWLTSALLDLEKRGLIQCDRQTGQFDLHPVVRGFAVGSLSAEARDEAGKTVADYFSTRSDPPYDQASSLRDLSNGLCVVKVLNLAGRYEAAYSAFNFDLNSALGRLDMPHEILALLRPLFPFGWGLPPAEVKESGRAARRAADALNRIGQFRNAGVQLEFSIHVAIKTKELAVLPGRLCEYWDSLRSLQQRARAARALELAGRCAEASDEQDELDSVNALRILDLLETGQTGQARAIWDDYLDPNTHPGVVDTQGRTTLTHRKALIDLHDNGELGEDLVSAIDVCLETSDRTFARILMAVLADYHYRDSNYELALEVIERAIGMARAAGIRSLYTIEYEGKRACCLAQLGRRTEALSAAEVAAAAPIPPHAELADAYLVLGTPEKAIHHALEGYAAAWGDGPPFSNLIDLEPCRGVLRALNHPEPRLPAFDPTKTEAFSFEADLEFLLQERFPALLH